MGVCVRSINRWSPNQILIPWGIQIISFRSICKPFANIHSLNKKGTYRWLILRKEQKLYPNSTVYKLKSLFSSIKSTETEYFKASSVQTRTKSVPWWPREMRLCTVTMHKFDYLHSFILCTLLCMIWALCTGLFCAQLLCTVIVHKLNSMHGITLCTIWTLCRGLFCEQ